ncbi:hypothetical protein DPEC_G00083790 [Dallia pectoralis]|uniref:Uncharacterized protein n=1 Tax=Dallia pectoralis TaxID=75939 RepID=A0ACC2GZI9_DALPE|nr:hypothetical protein DPEC_G00083790 [Dallia pectoralis]
MHRLAHADQLTEVNTTNAVVPKPTRSLCCGKRCVAAEPRETHQTSCPSEAAPQDQLNVLCYARYEAANAEACVRAPCCSGSLCALALRGPSDAFELVNIQVLSLRPTGFSADHQRRRAQECKRPAAITSAANKCFDRQVVAFPLVTFW